MPPPILLVHGACSQPAHMEPWRRFFTDAGYTCLAPDLPGHGADKTPLGNLRLRDYLAALVAIRGRMDAPPVVIGHSMGGLLAQMLAARTECAGLVLVASMPSGWFPPSLRAMPWFLPVAPSVLAGRPFRTNAPALRALTLHDLGRAEQDAIIAGFVPESGRVYREMVFGLGRVRGRVTCPVLVLTGSADRLVPAWAAGIIARRYGAEFTVIPGHGHWLIAGSLVPTVAPGVRDWVAGLPSFQRAGTV